MKKQLRFATLSMLAVLASGAFGQGQGIQVIVNGTPVNFPVQGPMMSGDRILVPLRGVLEQIGARVDWDPSTQTVTARRRDTRVSLHIGQTTAAVNDHPVNLDVPAQIVNGSTMVPLRFVSEALGENVKWDAATSTVNISDGGDYDLPPQRPLPPPPPPPNQNPPPPPLNENVIFDPGSVIQVRLNQDLGSDTNHRGDRFDATVTDWGAGLPRGTRVEGLVYAVRPRFRDHPGIVEFKFDRVDLPDHSWYPINGSLIGLDDTFIEHRGNRVFARRVPNNRAVFVGVGAAAGLIVGINDRRPIEDAAIGGILGGLLSETQRQTSSDVRLRRGTPMGVRLDSRFVVPASDLRGG